MYKNNIVAKLFKNLRWLNECIIEVSRLCQLQSNISNINADKNKIKKRRSSYTESCNSEKSGRTNKYKMESGMGTYHAQDTQDKLRTIISKVQETLNATF